MTREGRAAHLAALRRWYHGLRRPTWRQFRSALTWRLSRCIAGPVGLVHADARLERRSRAA